MFEREVEAFILFSFISGCVYILNDYVDLASDQKNPHKCQRPMASGQLEPRIALWFGAMTLITAITLGCFLNIVFGMMLMGYLVMNVAYSLGLKKVVFIDILMIALGFVIRTAAGGAAISVKLTPWFLCCALMLSLFLAAGKRKNEYMIWKKEHHMCRSVLQHYSSGLLNVLLVGTSSSLLMFYSLFTVFSGHSLYMMLTIPFVIYGVLRYFKLLYVDKVGGRPEMVLLKDKQTFCTILLFIAVVSMILCLSPK
ncbi:decaprenyl-phosphate phosphoribosyltransferase [Alicyclobacillus acidoterrestris]|uniref:UbiA prenyltransferase family protein n=1 Tax=Alicyclobacillus suci TaxID=2816080 RepID=UPI001196C52B|nr:UbiA prenyltransferase family protein [Alicyclobacillus suci]GEO27974.1 decaprenyl-phosphate phosphoribosyltransferase [Alicyclobacillus acidoterrestris]